MYINLTPHAIVLNDGTVYPPSGNIARVNTIFSDFEDGICTQIFGEVSGLPAPQEDTILIVSAMVLSACKDRNDVVAPATGHPDCVRNELGHIVSVPGFVRLIQP